MGRPEGSNRAQALGRRHALFLAGRRSLSMTGFLARRYLTAAPAARRLAVAAIPAV
jgi:hypothetical protein